MSATFCACVRTTSRLSASRSTRAWRAVPGLVLTQRTRLDVGPRRIRISGENARHFSWWPSRSAAPQTVEVLPEDSTTVAPPAAVSTTLPDTSPEPTASEIVDAAAAEATSALTTPLPEPTIVDSISTPIPPLQYGDLAALDLVHWTPAGFFPWVMELVQVSTSLPWWSVIVVTTVGARIFLLPFIVRSMRSASRIVPIQPQLAEHRAQMARLRASGSTDKLAMQQVMVKQQALMRKAGVNPFDALFASFSQIMVQFGFFIGLRRMCTLPVEQLKEGGIGYLLDLTAPDPFYILPAVTTTLINVQLSLSSRDLAVSSGPAGPHIINGFRLLSILGVWFMAAFPAGINFHILTSVTFMCLQTLVLRIPSVRARLNLAPLPPLASAMKSPSMRDTFQYVKEAIMRQQTEAIAKAEEDRRRRKAMKR